MSIKSTLQAAKKANLTPQENKFVKRILVNDWTEFFIYPGTNSPLKAKYRINDLGEVMIVLCFHAPQGQYLSFKEDAYQTAKEMFNLK